MIPTLSPRVIEKTESFAKYYAIVGLSVLTLVIVLYAISSLLRIGTRSETRLYEKAEEYLRKLLAFFGPIIVTSLTYWIAYLIQNYKEQIIIALNSPFVMPLGLVASKSPAFFVWID